MNCVLSLAKLGSFTDVNAGEALFYSLLGMVVIFLVLAFLIGAVLIYKAVFALMSGDKKKKEEIDDDTAAKEEERRRILMYHAAANSYAYYHYSNPQVHYQPVVQQPVVQPRVTPTPTDTNPKPSPFDTWGIINKHTENREFIYQGGRNLGKGEYRTF